MLLKINFQCFKMILILDLILFAASIPEFTDSSGSDLEPLFRM